MLKREKIRKNCGDIGTQGNYGKRTRTVLLDPQNKKNITLLYYYYLLFPREQLEKWYANFFQDVKQFSEVHVELETQESQWFQ